MNEERREKLLDLVEKVIKENILSKKEFKMKVAPVLVKNNDSRKIDRLITDLLDGKTDEVKDQDIENLLVTLNEYSSEIKNEATIEQSNQESDEEKILTENYKLTGMYNESLIKIQKLEKQIQNQNNLEKQLDSLKSEINKFKSLDLEKILEENKLYSEMFKITGTSLIEVPDEDIDALYVRYKTKGIKEYKKAFITDNEIIPKTYYDMKGGK